jgi:hypothetical protein
MISSAIHNPVRDLRKGCQKSRMFAETVETYNFLRGILPNSEVILHISLPISENE